MYHTPGEELEEMYPDGIACSECGTSLVDEAYFDGNSEYYCERCHDKLVAEVESEAEQHAEKECRITAELPKFRPDEQYRCSPEEYDSGLRESYTRNSVPAWCRHNCTNYESLIKDLDRDHWVDRAYYAAIHGRIMDLLDDALEEEYRDVDYDVGEDDDERDDDHPGSD